MNKHEPIRKTATISFGPDFLPAIINLPLSVILDYRSLEDEGYSQVTVITNALFHYRQKIEKSNSDAGEKDLILSKISEIEGTLRGESTRRLSAVCDLLHDIRFDRLDTDRRREPLT